MTGIVFSNVLLPVMPAILQSGTIYLSTNTGPENYAGAGCNPNFFAVAWQNEDIPAAMGKYAADQGYKRVALIAPDYPGGRESLNGFKRLYKGGLSEEIYTQLGQLDYGVEITRLRASKPDAVFFFLPGGMGVNFIKQFNGAGLGQEIALLAPGFSGDEDTIAAVGEPIRACTTPRNGRRTWTIPPTASSSRISRRPTSACRRCTPRRVTTPPCCWTARCARPAAAGRGHAASGAAPRRFQVGARRFQVQPQPVSHPELLPADHRGWRGRQAGEQALGTVLTQYQDPFAASCQME